MGHTVAELLSSSIITLILIIGISMTSVKHAVKRQNFNFLKNVLKLLDLSEALVFMLYVQEVVTNFI